MHHTDVLKTLMQMYLIMKCCYGLTSAMLWSLYFHNYGNKQKLGIVMGYTAFMTLVDILYGICI
jgi:hypothetical protein